MPKGLTPARLEWSDDQTPYSSEYQDIYYSSSGGAKESRHVFVDQNGLPERWHQPDLNSFVIAETGFGTGRNFFETWLLWQQEKNAGRINNDARLHFISTELHPYNIQDLKTIWALWPQFHQLADQLASHWPYLVPGFHRLTLDDVSLTLIFDDSAKGLSKLEASIDCWYLDGFSPANNPDMWSETLFEQMARLSGYGTTLATYSVARSVRQGLSRKGFEISKVDGYGMKKYMLTARFVSPGPSRPGNQQPWFNYASPHTSKPNSPVAIIGAGIAGSTTAFSLCNRGYQVEVFDQQDFSQVPESFSLQGILYVKLSAELPAHSQFYAQGFEYSLAALSHQSGVEWNRTGVIQLAYDEAEASRQKKFIEKSPYPKELIHAIDSETATDLAGIDIHLDGLRFPDGAWVNPISLCREYLKPAKLTDKTQITQVFKQAKDWYVTTADQKVLGPYSAVVVACSNSAINLEALAPLPIKSIRGQKTFTHSSDFPLKTVICGKAYIAPSLNGQFNFGATYHQNDTDSEPREADDQSNQQAINDCVPALTPWVNQRPSFGIVGFRCTTPDYTPIVGAVPDWQRFEINFQDMTRFKQKIFQPAPLQSGLYCNIGHGSRGLASVFLSAELIACQLNGEPLPVSRTVADHLNPARFLVKKLRKSQN